MILFHIIIHPAKWKLFFDHYLGKYGGKLLFRSNLKQQDSALLNLKDPFLKEIIQYWTKFNYKDDNLDFASMIQLSH